MKIWMMNHYATLMLQNRAGRHYWFAKELESRNHDVTVFCSAASSVTAEGLEFGGKKWVEKSDERSRFVYVKNKEYLANGIDRVKNMVSFFFNLFPVTADYKRQYGKPDVIIASSVHPLTMVAGILIARRLKVPCICEIRDLWPEAIFAFGKSREKSILGRILIAGEHWIYKNAHALIFTKEGDTDYLKEKGWTTAQGGDIDLAKCHYINNGVNLQAYLRQIETEVLDDENLSDDAAFNVTYTGTIRPVNNVGNLLDCAKILRDKSGYDDVRFMIFGDGSEMERLKKRVEDENLSTVCFKGRIAKKYIPYVLSKSSINMLNYSQTEYNWSRGNSSNKLFEYMASGKPIISTVKMGYSIIDRYHCGVELDNCTPEALADEIMRMHDLPAEELRVLGDNGRKGVEDFDFIKLTDRLMDVVRSVV